MGRRRRKDAEENDATTGWKRFLVYMSRPGMSARAKRRIRRRERREGKRSVRDERGEG